MTLTDLIQRIGFSTQAYLDLNLDLPRHLRPAELIDHYVRYGISENRRVTFTASSAELIATVEGRPAAKSLIESAACSTLNSIDVKAANGDDIDRLLAFSEALTPLVVVGDSHGAFWLNRTVISQGFMPAPLICYSASARGMISRDLQSGYGRRSRPS